MVSEAFSHVATGHFVHYGNKNMVGRLCLTTNITLNSGFEQTGQIGLGSRMKAGKGLFEPRRTKHLQILLFKNLRVKLFRVREKSR